MKTNQSKRLHRPMHSSQRGVGMVEVLVAMVLLAIGVLGYSAMQIRAVEATGDALTRSQAMVILRGLAENIRVMDTADQSNYTANVHAYASMTSPTSPAVPTPNCKTAACTATQMAAYDAYQTALTAFQKGIHVDMYACPLTATTNADRRCLVAAWGVTTPTSGTTAATDCITQAGIYYPNATCVMLEAY